MSKIEQQTQDEQQATAPVEIPAEQAPKGKGRKKGDAAPKGKGTKAPAKAKKQVAPKAPKAKGDEPKRKGDKAPAKAAPDSTPKQAGRLFRIAQVNTPSGGKAIVGVTLDGRPDAGSRRTLGNEIRIPAWVEIRAGSWAEATAQFRAGQGKKVRAPR